ncbi:MAG: DUF3149 domain-containing protein [Clostridiales bacterium]|nr:DUF3149 domain-containing protein [Clostridiales bacterium]
MIEYFKSDIGLIISMFVIFVMGIGIGAAITDAINNMKEDDKHEKTR